MHSRTLFFYMCAMAFCSSTATIARGDDRAFGIEQRALLTTSRVVGAPDDPLPFRLRRVFPERTFKEPLYLVPEPGTKRLFVLERAGKVLAFEPDAPSQPPQVVLDLTNEPQFRREAYSIIFHPRYPEQRELFLFANLGYRDGEARRHNRISRFRIADGPAAVIDVALEESIIEWPSAGHDGGDMAFGADGYLYLTTGDGTSGSDLDETGQDLSDLLGSVLRIDVDRADEGRRYCIPPDNPFVDVEGARPEIWSFGHRAPWRLSFDAPTETMWLGEVGQDLWEMIHIVRRGGNYGWSVVEGGYPFYPERAKGPGDILNPIAVHHHSEARSITGGYVYRGTRWPDLHGMYVYCDYETGKVWALRYENERVTAHRELADSSYKVAAFGLDHQGELYLVALSGEILEFEKNPAADQPLAAFPRHLSETGLFASVQNHEPASGVVPYSVNSPLWSDGAFKERFIAVPGEGQISPTGKRGWEFPEASVLVKTFSLETNRQNPTNRRRIETRLLTKQQGEWVGYSYAWNDEQTDAELVERGGDNRIYEIRDGEQASLQSWRFPSRAECMVCHSRAANYVLGLSTLQMDRDHDYGAVSDNQLRTLEHIGLLTRSPTDMPGEHRLVDPYDRTASLEARARSYLHANCSQCHVSDGGGNAKIELEVFTPLADTKFYDVVPLQGSFDILNSRLIAPGSPERSVLLHRVSTRSRGQMPPLATSLRDEQAIELLAEWIRQLPTDDSEHSK